MVQRCAEESSASFEGEKFKIHSAVKEFADKMYRMLEHDLAAYPMSDEKSKENRKRESASIAAIPRLQQFFDNDWEEATCG